MSPGAIQNDPTVDDLNPLGVTIVTYEPDTAGIREMLRAASDSYVELQRQFDLVIADFLQQLDLAQDDLNATLE